MQLRGERSKRAELNDYREWDVRYETLSVKTARTNQFRTVKIPLSPWQ